MLHYEVQAVQAILSGGSSAVASLAPSFPAAIGQADSGQLVAALRRLGFVAVEETVTVLPEVIEQRRDLLARADGPLIGTSCPIIVNLVRREFPALATRLAEMASPMLQHGQRLKKRYGADTTVVFFGLCRAKAVEARGACGRPVDHVLIFNDLLAWLESSRIVLTDLPPDPFDLTPPAWARCSVLLTRVSGVAESRAFLRTLAARSIATDSTADSEFLELLACRGGCLNGPGVGVSTPLEHRREQIMRFAGQVTQGSAGR